MTSTLSTAADTLCIYECKKYSRLHPRALVWKNIRLKPEDETKKKYIHIMTNRFINIQ